MSKRKRAPDSQIGRSRDEGLIPDHCTPGTAGALNDGGIHRPYHSWSPFGPFDITISQTSESRADIDENSTNIYRNPLDAGANIALSQSI